MPLALVGVALWDGAAERRDPRPHTLRIEGERLVAVGTDPALAEGAEVHSLEGATALPGLIDAHVHLTLDPGVRSPEEQLRVPHDRVTAAMEARALAMLRAGITTARDLGGGSWLELALRDRIARGELPGPRLLCSGQPLTSPGGHCHYWGGEAEGSDAIAAVLRRQLEHGVDWIKVMATGGMLTKGTRIRDAQFDVPDLEAIVRGAAARGRRVAAHCHGTAGIRNAAQAGVATIEHCSFAGDQGFGTDPDPAVAELVAARGVHVSPTVNAGWERRLLRGEDGRPTAFAERMTRCFELLRKAGVPLIASTDAGIPGVRHHELPQALAALATYAALDPLEALRAATSASARALGLGDETGVLRAGLAADVLVVEGDPTADLGALASPRLVVARGRPIEPLPPAS